MIVYTARKTVWSQASAHFWENSSGREEASAFYRPATSRFCHSLQKSPCGNRLPAKARWQLWMRSLSPSLPTVTTLCRDLDQNANLRPFSYPCSTCLSFHKDEVLIFLCAASNDDGVPTHYSPRGSHTDGHHFDSNLVLESINPLHISRVEDMLQVPTYSLWWPISDKCLI